MHRKRPPVAFTTIALAADIMDGDIKEGFFAFLLQTPSVDDKFYFTIQTDFCTRSQTVLKQG